MDNDFEKLRARGIDPTREAFSGNFTAQVTLTLSGREVLEGVKMFLQENPDSTLWGEKLLRAGIARDLQACLYDGGGMHGEFEVESLAVCRPSPREA